MSKSHKSLQWCNSRGDQICPQQRDFYQHTMGYEEDYEYAFAETKWEPTNSARPARQISIAPGYDWQESNIRIERRNTSNIQAEGVRMWDIDGTSTTVYPDEVLHKQIIIDENREQEVHTFKNGAGQTILRRVVKTDTPNVSEGDTYYIYDDFGNLSYVIPPLATQQLKTSGVGTWSVAFVDDLIYAYTYDERQRVTRKKIPNKGMEAFVYDRLDRVVLSRDSLLREQKEWLFTKYDVLSRPVLTGTYHSGSTLDDITDSELSDKSLFERRINDAPNHDYTNEAFPMDDIDILTVNYYDDYEYEGAEPASIVDHWFRRNYRPTLDKFKGKLTGTKTKVLHHSSLSDLNEWITASYHYTKDGQMLSENGNTHLSEQIVRRNFLHNEFSGLLLKQMTKIEGPNERRYATKWYEYSPHNQQLNSFTASTGTMYWEMLNNYYHQETARYSYDELGRLSQKKLHISKDSNFDGTGNGVESDPLQVVDYTYNIRGWLTDINKTDSTRVGVTDDTGGTNPPRIAYCWEDQMVSLLTIAKKLEAAQEELSLPEESSLPFLTYLYDRFLADNPDLTVSIYLDIADQIEAQKVVDRLATTGRFTTTTQVAQPIYPLGEVVQLSHTIATTPVDNYEPFTGIPESEINPSGSDDEGTTVGVGNPNIGGIGNWDNPHSELAPIFTPLQQLSIPDRTSTAQGYQIVSTELVGVGLDLCTPEEEEDGTTVQTPPVKPCWTKQHISLLDVYESMNHAETVLSLSPQATKATVTYLHQRLPDPLPTAPNSVHIRTDQVPLANQLIQVLDEGGRTATQEEITRPSYSVEAVAALTHTIATTPIGDPTATVTPPDVAAEITQQASELVVTLQELTTVEQSAIGTAYQMITYDVITLGEQLCGPQPQQFAPNSEEEDLFALALHYQKDFGEPTAERQYNGNIAAMDWQVYAPGATTAPLRRYVFDYDAQNRLIQANYFEHLKSNIAGESSEWMDNQANYSVNDIRYDLNGNITHLERMGLTSINHYDTIDQLTYTYIGNKLTSVEDGVQLSDVGFEDNPPLSDGGRSSDYEYDGNGNLTRDKNRKIYITYDYRLNLPVAISRYEGDGTNPAIIEALHFIYDAHGNKLAQCIHDVSTTRQNGGQPLRLSDIQQMVATGDWDNWANLLRSMPVTTRRDYVAGIEYADGEAESFYHEEGRILLSYDDGDWEGADNNAAYEYTLSDHLGNGRIYFGDKNNDGKAEILQENHYYPFGMQMEGIGSAAHFPENNYGYNGIEELSDFDLEVSHATYRTLDPAIGRWWQVDPEAESFYGMSPYNSMANNPVIMVDPDGDLAVIGSILIGAAIGAAIHTGGHLVTNGGKFDNWNWGAFVGSVVSGAIGGAVSFGMTSAGFGGFQGGFVTGGAGSFSQTLTSQVINGDFNFGQLALNTGIGAGVGGLIQGISAGLKGNEFWDGSSVSYTSLAEDSGLSHIRQNSPANCTCATGEMSLKAQGVNQFNQNDLRRLVDPTNNSLLPLSDNKVLGALHKHGGLSVDGVYSGNITGYSSNSHYVSKSLAQGRSVFLTVKGTAFNHSVSVKGAYLRNATLVNGKIKSSLVFKIFDPAKASFNYVDKNYINNNIYNLFSVWKP